MDATDAGVEIMAAGETLARARTGDAEAFCRLTEPLQTRLLRQAAALSGDLNCAEDLVSETLVEAWKGVGKYAGMAVVALTAAAGMIHHMLQGPNRVSERDEENADRLAGENR